MKNLIILLSAVLITGCSAQYKTADYDINDICSGIWAVETEWEETEVVFFTDHTYRYCLNQKWSPYEKYYYFEGHIVLLTNLEFDLNDMEHYQVMANDSLSTLKRIR